MHNIPILPPDGALVEPSVSPFGRQTRSPLRVGALFLALTVGVAACGSAADDSAQVATDTEAPAASTDDSSVDDDAAPADDAADESDDAAAGDDTAQSADEEVAAENVFPDLNVMSITDGADVNLRDELANGDTAVLLWFFAPH